MPHQRPQSRTQAQPSAPQAHVQARPESPQQVFLADVARDVKALNSAVLVLGQKMQFLVRNEKILGRNLLVLNKKIEDFQKVKGTDEAGSLGSKELEGLRQEFEANSAELGRLSRSVSELRDALEQVKINYAKSEDLKEVKYVIDAINPLEFVSVKQLDSLLEKRLKDSKKK